MKIAVAGATGFIGTALTAHLAAAGHRVVRLVRRKPDASRGDVAWDPSRGVLDPAVLDGVAAVVNLAGEPVAERWTAERKRRIKASRVEATALLAKTVVGLPRPPRVLVNASAMAIAATKYSTKARRPAVGFLRTLPAPGKTPRSQSPSAASGPCSRGSASC
jgi:NAD dependent epimerase/dehydratase family enzyme